MLAPANAPMAPPTTAPSRPCTLCPIAAPMPAPTRAPSSGSLALACVESVATATVAARAATIKGFLLSLLDMSISYRLVGGLRHRGIRHCLLPAIPSIDRLRATKDNDEFLPAVHTHCLP